MAEGIFLADASQPMLEEYIYRFLEHEQEVIGGQRHIFDEVYAPLLMQEGVGAVNLEVGGERAVQNLYSNTDKYRFWDAHKKLDCLNCEMEAGAESFLLCRTAADVDRALAKGKIAIFATLAGGKPLEGKENLNSLSSLRSLFRAGLRGLQLTGNDRNRLGDGAGQACTRGKLTDFGKRVVEECDRLRILIDTAQLSDYGFWDLMELTDRAVIDSHTGAKACSDHPCCLTRERMQAIAARGGVIGISFLAALVAAGKDVVTTEDLFRQIDYMAETVGAEHLCFGPQYSPFQTPVDRQRVLGWGNLGPDACDFDWNTPIQSEKYPGWVDGVWYGRRENDYVVELSSRDRFPAIVGLMRSHGYSDLDCANICGKSLIRVYQQALPKE